VQFLTVLVREAHPGTRYGHHQSYEQKMRHARDFREVEGISWPVLVDHLDGDVHRTYGELPNKVVLVDTEGRVAFEAKWNHAPTIRRALEALLRRGGRGVVEGGVDRVPHLLAAMVRGGPARAGRRRGCT
jgi:hypothetical protein